MTGPRPALTAAIALLGCGAAAACGDELGPGASRLADAQYQLVFKSTPQPLPLGRHFMLDFVICPQAGRPQPLQVRVDAHMPEHKHGMNYRASVTTDASGQGRYRAEGLMFHMPGRWELFFELRGLDGTARLAQSLQLE